MDSGDARAPVLAARLRALLCDQARQGDVATYKELAQRLELVPPQTIHRVTVALEMLMAEDVAAGRPLLAALAVSRQYRGMPGRGFFITADGLGIYSGPFEGDEARAFHAQERDRALAFYG